MNPAKKLVLDFFDAAVADIGATNDFVATDLVQHGSGLPGTASALPEFIRRASGAGKAELLDPVFVIAENDLVTTCYYLPQPDPRHPGSTYQYYSFDTYRVRDGRIAEHWPSSDKAAPPLRIPDPGVARWAAADLSPEPHDLAAGKRLVLEFCRRVFDAHDPDAVAEFLAEDYRQHASHALPGRDGVAQFVRDTFPGGPIPAPAEISVPPSVVVAEADLVVIAGLLPQPEPGLGGTTYPYYVYDAYRVRGGMLAEHWSGVNIAAPPVHGPEIVKEQG
ncbi:nuclear transport factor 2 family protein [Amycolatopsis sp. NPDC051758]|uniref:nuclear transport factor 2 family protein n=1 Tax=Amycolatopsis sp. NPDC051758 TaxID=3363935 RepID=UPI00379D3289